MSLVDHRDGTPLDNYYRHGWREGTETVDVYIDFDVQWYEPGAGLTLTDVYVR